MLIVEAKVVSVNKIDTHRAELATEKQHSFVTGSLVLLRDGRVASTGSSEEMSQEGHKVVGVTDQSFTINWDGDPEELFAEELLQDGHGRAVRKYQFTPDMNSALEVLLTRFRYVTTQSIVDENEVEAILEAWRDSMGTDLRRAEQLDQIKEAMKKAAPALAGMAGTAVKGLWTVVSGMVGLG